MFRGSLSRSLNIIALCSYFSLILLCFLMFPRVARSYRNFLPLLKSHRNSRCFSHIDTSMSDTIYALSSGPMVKCGVSVIRLSGPRCLEIAGNLLDPGHRLNPPQSPSYSQSDTSATTILTPRKAALRKLYCPVSGDILDQSLLLWFPQPNSFTGEDVLELHVHGSRAVILGLFHALEHLDSAKGRIRPAERGEFSRRAFENGKMDLTGVEGLSDLLESDTAEQRKQALKQMDGHMRDIYERWRSELIRSLAHTEAVIDFGDDDRENDINDDAMWSLIPHVRRLRDEIYSYLRDGRRGEIVREGISIALVGKPNSGKSSLINSLARRPLAIVSPIAGTTRDIVQVRMDLGGISCTISDTAGLRESSDDPIELEGMKRAREAFNKAHIRVFVCDINDLTQSNNEEPTALLDTLITKNMPSTQVNPKQEDDDDMEDSISKTLVVINKMDTVKSVNDIFRRDTNDTFVISCLTGEGINSLESGLTKVIQSMLEENGSKSEGILITRERHRTHIKQCLEHLDAFLDQKLSMDLAAEELRLAMQEIGKVTGRVDVEEILDVLFRDFCIGK